MQNVMSNDFLANERHMDSNFSLRHTSLVLFNMEQFYIPLRASNLYMPVHYDGTCNITVRRTLWQSLTNVLHVYLYKT